MLLELADELTRATDGRRRLAQAPAAPRIAPQLSEFKQDQA
jgi:hypothetical protein